MNIQALIVLGELGSLGEHPEDPELGVVVGAL